MKSKYFHNSFFWTAKTDGPRSIFWSSILQVRQNLTQNAIYQIHNGNSSIWSSPWCPIWDSIHNHLRLSVTHTPLPSVVSDLWHPNTHHWNHDLIDIVFDNKAAQIISQVITVDSASHDTLRWIPAKRGDCTTKNIHRSLSSQAQGPSTASNHRIHEYSTSSQPHPLSHVEIQKFGPTD
jgi:hypothetical protein